MSLRSLAVDIMFNTETDKLLAVDSAVDDIRDSALDASDSVDALKKTTESIGGNIAEKLGGIGESLTGFGKKLSLGVTTPLVAGGTAAFKFAKDQQTAFAQVSTLLEGSAEDYDQYKKDIRAVSSDMGVVFEDYAEAVYSSISAGQDQGDAIEFTRKAVMLAGGGFTETAKAVDVMTTALNAYGLESSEATNISDMLITTQNLGKTTVDELAASMGAVIPVAQAQGVSFDQLSAGYAVLTKNGIGTAEAGTYMKAMFGELGKAGSKVDEILRKETGKSFSELQESGMNTGEVLGILQEKADKSGLKLSDMFGSVQAGSAALVLAKNDGTEFNDFLGEMQNSTGATEAAFDKMADTTGDKMQIAWVTIKNTLAGVGDTMLPLAADLAQSVEGLVSKFGNLSPLIQKNILIFGGIAAAIGPSLVVVGKLISSAGSIIGVFGKMSTAIQGAGGVFALLSNPIGLAVAAIGLIITTVVIAYNKVEWFRDAVNSAWEFIKDSTSFAFEWISNIVQIVMENVMSFMSGVLSRITDFWNEHGESIMIIIEGAFSSIQSTIAMVMGVIQGIFEIGWPIISGVVEVAWGLIQLIVNTGLDIILGLVSTVMSLLQGDWSGAWETIKGIASDIWINIEDFFRKVDLLQIGKDIIQGLIDGIGSMASAVWDKVKEIGDGIANTFKSVLKIFSPSRLFKQFGEDTMLGYTIGFEAESENMNTAAEMAAINIAESFNPDLDSDVPIPSYKSFQPSNKNSHSQTHASFNPSFDIHIHGKGEAVAQDVKKELERYFPELMDQFFAMLAVKRP